jgi:hypothetical protein
MVTGPVVPALIREAARDGKRGDAGKTGAARLRKRCFTTTTIGR